ncbi:MAG TPA: GatB/YqeY domain-containing protein, partial [Campylobacterales bacterium]|nr:GatB/YqeY domain-containing protein [Campylobacterales bacterium]
REDSASQFKEAGRDDLYEKEMKEAEILKVYMPKQLSEEELTTVINATIAKLGASSMKEMGMVMKAVNEEVGSSADGKTISNLVKDLLK